MGNFHFLSFFSKLSSRPQVKLINIHEHFGGFNFSSPSRFNAIHAFNMQFHVSQKHSTFFCFQFLTSYSVSYPCVQKLHRVPYLALGTNFFPKTTSGETWNMAERINDVMRIETSLVAVSS